MAVVHLDGISMVPADELDQPEYVYQASVDFSKTFKKSGDFVSSLCILLTALLNTVGGILRLSNQPGTDCGSKLTDQWQIDMTQKLSSFICERERFITSALKRVDAQNVQLTIFVCKSINFVTLDSFMFVSDGSQRTKVHTTAEITQRMNQRTSKSLVSLPIQNDHVHHGFDEMPVEADNIEYKYWKIDEKLEVNKKKKDQPHTEIELYKKLLRKEASNSLFAFPNECRGGKLVIGVDEKDGNIVKGQILSEENRSKLVEFIQELLTEDPLTKEKRIWGRIGTTPQRGIHWDLDYVHVDQAPNGNRLLILVHLYHCVGGVFQKCPQAYTVDNEGNVRQLTFEEWRASCIKHEKAFSSAVKRTVPLHLLRKDFMTLQDLRIEDDDLDLVDDVFGKRLKAETKLSWIDHNSQWQKRIHITSKKLSTSVFELASESNVFKPSRPLNSTPSEDVLKQACPNIEHLLLDMNNVYCNQGSVLVCRRMLDCFANATVVPRFSGHSVDMLIIHDGGFHLKVVIGEQGNQANETVQKAYLFLSGRTIKRHLIEALFEENKCFQFSMSCDIYSIQNRREITSSITPEALVDGRLTHKDCAIALASLLLSKKTHIKDIIGKELSIFHTAEQYEVIINAELSMVAFITGPPGTGKSLIGIKLCQYYKKSEILYIASGPEFTSYIAYQDICDTALVRSDQDMQDLVAGNRLEDRLCVILDDVQNMCISSNSWQSFLTCVSHHANIRLLFLGDPEVQSYMQESNMHDLRLQVQSHCEKEDISFQSCQLHYVHRNSKKMTSYVQHCSALQKPIPCTSELEGDDVETLVMSGILTDSDTNPLVNYIRSITLTPEEQLDLGAVSSHSNTYADVLMMVSGPHPGPVVEQIRGLLTKYLGSASVQPPLTYPVKGIRIGAVGEYSGLESPMMCQVVTREGTRDGVHSLLEPQYRAFVSSRAITKLVYITEQLGTKLAIGLGYSNIDRLRPTLSTMQDTTVEEPAQSEEFLRGAQTAGRLKTFLDQQTGDVAKVLTQMRAHTEPAFLSDDKPALVELGPHYLPVLLQLTSAAESRVDAATLTLAWRVMAYLTLEETNRELYVSEGGVELGFSALERHTDANVLFMVLVAIGYIATSLHSEIIKPAYIDRLLGLLAHEDQRVSFRSCRMLSDLILYGPATSDWPDVDVDRVSKQMIAAMAKWKLGVSIGISTDDLTWEKDNFTHRHPAVSYHVSWGMAHFVTEDPGKYCDIVVRDIGLEYIKTCIMEGRSCPQAEELLLTVLSTCRRHILNN